MSTNIEKLNIPPPVLIHLINLIVNADIGADDTFGEVSHKLARTLGKFTKRGACSIVSVLPAHEQSGKPFILVSWAIDDKSNDPVLRLSLEDIRALSTMDLC